MTDLFYSGEPIFMGILTLLLLVILSMAVVMGIQTFTHKVKNTLIMRHRITYIKSVGLFALVFGIFGQLLGLYGAFLAIEAAGDISPSLLYAGLRISAITTIYGMVIYLLSYLLWLGLDVRLNHTPSVS